MSVDFPSWEEAATRVVAPARLGSSGDPDRAIELAIAVAATTMRRLLSMRGSCWPGTLVRAASAALRGAPLCDLTPEEVAREALEALLDDRDALEASEQEGGGCRIHALAPVAVHLEGSHELLLTGCGFKDELLAHQAADELVVRGHRRWLRGEPAVVREAGVRVASGRTWARPPRTTTGELRAAVLALLDQGSLAGELPGLEVLQPGPRPTWSRLSGSEPGAYVARRTGTWGERRWYLIRVASGGRAEVAVDLSRAHATLALPAPSNHERGWLAHLALHQEHATAPLATVSRHGGYSNSPLLTLELPAPPWIGRQLDLLAYREGTRWRTRWTLRCETQGRALELLRPLYRVEEIA